MDGWTQMHYAWVIYVAGGLGCTLATWWLFSRWRPLAHFFSITVAVLTLTPYAIDAQTMTMAPALFSLFFGIVEDGMKSTIPVMKLLLGIWAVLQVLSILYQLLTRHKAEDTKPAPVRGGTPHGGGRSSGYSDNESDDTIDYRASSSRSSSYSSRSGNRYGKNASTTEEPIRAVR